MSNFKRNDVYFSYRNPFSNSNKSKSRSIVNEDLNNNIFNRNVTLEIWNDKNIKKFHRLVDLYDYIIISNNNYKEILKDIDNNLKILILEKNKNNDEYEITKLTENKDEKEYLIKNNIIIKFEKELLSIEKYIYNDNIYCVFENKKKINYFSKNIIIANDSIKTNVIMNNITEEETKEYIKQQELIKEKEENKKEEDEKELTYTTIKYYVRTYTNICNNIFQRETYTFSTTPNGKSINNFLTLNKGTKYIFEMTSDICPFNIVSSSGSINFKSTSNKNIYKNIGSILKGETIEFYIPEDFNRSIFYFGFVNTKKVRAFKINKKNILSNMYLTYN